MRPVHKDHMVEHRRSRVHRVKWAMLDLPATEDIRANEERQVQRARRETKAKPDCKVFLPQCWGCREMRAAPEKAESRARKACRATQAHKGQKE